MLAGVGLVAIVGVAVSGIIAIAQPRPKTPKYTYQQIVEVRHEFYPGLVCRLDTYYSSTGNYVGWCSISNESFSAVIEESEIIGLAKPKNGAKP